MNHEQMLLCTIAPFKDACERLPDDVQEASIHVNFRNRELKLSDSLGQSTTIDIASLRSIEWLSLMGAPYCKLTAVLSRYKNGAIALAIRIYLLKDAILEERQKSSFCDSNFLAFETMLSTTMKEQGYFIEPVEKKRKTLQNDFVTKLISVHATTKVADDLFWCFHSLLFTKEEKVQKVEAVPVAIVASVTQHWRENILQTILSAMNQKRKCAPSCSVDGLLCGTSTVHIITKEPKEWLQVALEAGLTARLLEHDGVPVSFLDLNDGILISSPDILARNIISSQNLFTTLEHVLTNTILHNVPRVAQVNRFFVEKLCKKFTNMQCTADLIQFGFLLIDNNDDVDVVSASQLLCPKGSLRCLKIIRDETTTRPKSISMLQATKLCNLHASYMPSYMNSLDLLTIAVPKYVLKKFRVFNHIIKNGPVEERIAKTFASKYCPVSINDAIQRFSGRPVPIDVAKELVSRHYNRLSISLGSFLLPSVETSGQSLSSEFTLGSLNNETQNCSICFDVLEQGFSITICGHIYCTECCRQQFNEDWSAFRPKECAACRTPLLMGDVVQVESFTKKAPFVPALASKELSIKNFLGGLRHSHYELYSGREMGAKVREWPKHVIINDITSTKACEIIREYSSASHTINIQVFSSAHESSQFLQFEQCF